MNIVLDTNVLVSGFLSPFSPPGDIVRWVVSGEVRLCLDARLIAEYTEVLKRPRFGFDAGSVAAFIDHLMHTGVLVSGAPLAAPLPDAMDEAFLFETITT
ncbi:MAG: PIN domain-containing protein [Candidatus Sumerlaeota bacterium]|nr:PIN domain-containing protein [Candidatus Sumerlaeota bacterium]